VGQYLEDPNRHSQNSATAMVAPVSDSKGEKSNGADSKDATSKGAEFNGASSKGVDSKDSSVPVYSPPPYAPPSKNTNKPPMNTSNGRVHRPHTNAVIEAGHIRARDEVRSTVR